MRKRKILQTRNSVEAQVKYVCRGRYAVGNAYKIFICTLHRVLKTATLFKTGFGY